MLRPVAVLFLVFRCVVPSSQLQVKKKTPLYVYFRAMYFTSFQGSLIQCTRLWMKTLMETDFERARLDKRINRMEEC